MLYDTFVVMMHIACFFYVAGAIWVIVSRGPAEGVGLLLLIIGIALFFFAFILNVGITVL
jgi:hypothetical protein